MLKQKLFKKITLLGIMLVLTNVIFAQSNWILDYITNDFGDRTGECRIYSKGYGDDLSEYDIMVTLLDDMYLFSIWNSMWKKNIENELDVRVSVKLPDNTIFSFEGFIYNEYGDDPAIVLLEENTKLLNLMKNSTKLKIACNIRSYEIIIFNLDCTGFTKAFNEMLICK